MNLNISVIQKAIVAVLVLASLSVQAAKNSMSTTYRAKEASTKKAGVNLEPLPLLYGGVGLKAEYFVTPKISAGLGGQFLNYTVKHEDPNSEQAKIGGDYKIEHYEVLIGSNIMLTGSLATSGFYLNPAVGYQSTAIKNYSIFNLSGSIESPMARLTAGYQWITAKNLRFGLGAGGTLIQGNDIIVKDNTGKEVLREKASNMSGAALDLQVGFLF